MLDKEAELIKRLPTIAASPPTLLEVGGYPHYENVVSNYLAYYFDPSEEHQFGSLLLDAWSSVLGIPIESNLGSVEVNREVATTSIKRIDLLIITSKRVYCIENKVFHHAEGNPFKKYQEYVKEIYPNRDRYFSILSLEEVAKEIIEESGFQNVTYPDFIAAIRTQIKSSNHIKQNNFQFQFLQSLLKTIENLIQKRVMQKEVLEIIQNNYESFQKLSSHLTNLQKDMDTRAQNLKDAVKGEPFPIHCTQTWLSGKEAARKDLKAVLFYNLGEYPNIELKLRLTPKGWTIELWGVEKHLKLLSTLKELGEGIFTKKDQCYLYGTDQPFDYYISPQTIVGNLETMFKILKISS